MSSYPCLHISPLPPPHFYRPTPNHLCSYIPHAQTTSIYHASPLLPRSEHLKDCTRPHFASYPSETHHTSISPSCTLLSPGYADSQPSLPISVPYVNTLWTQALTGPALANKLAPLPLPDCVCNWLLNFLSQRKHCTKYAGLISQLASITASFIQGSGTAPTSFVISMSDLILNNFLLKYADDIDFVIPPTNADNIETELQGISDWAAKNNLALNYVKSHHIVIRRPRFPRDHESIAKVNSI